MSVKTIKYTLNIKNEVNIFESLTTFLLFSVLLTYSRNIFSDVLGINTGRCWGRVEGAQSRSCYMWAELLRPLLNSRGWLPGHLYSRGLTHQLCHVLHISLHLLQNMVMIYASFSYQSIKPQLLLLAPDFLNPCFLWEMFKCTPQNKNMSITQFRGQKWKN